MIGGWLAEVFKSFGSITDFQFDARPTLDVWRKASGKFTLKEFFSFPKRNALLVSSSEFYAQQL